MSSTRSKLVKLRERMEERGETVATLHEKTGVSRVRILACMQATDHKVTQATEEEAIALANALACYPENLAGKASDPIKGWPNHKYSKRMSIEEDNLGLSLEYNW